MAEALRIAVCVKQILDPEIPVGAFRLDERGLEPEITGRPTAQVMDAYAANALETGLRLRDDVPGSRVTALCVGNAAAETVLRRAFALTADAAVRAWDESWRDLDALGVAHVLARVAEQVGPFDLLLCGREAGDIEEGVVGPALAEELALACVTLGRHVECGGRVLRVERAGDGFVTQVEATLPVVVTIAGSAGNVPRMAKARDTMLARMKPIVVCSASQLGVDPARVRPRVRLERLVLQELEGECEQILGDDRPAELARRLASIVAGGKPVKRERA